MTSSGRNGDGFSIIEEKAVPDTYADSTRFEVTVYGVTIEFGQLRIGGGAAGQAQHIPQMRVHISPQHAKVIAKLFVKQMRAYEEQMGKIPLPQALLDELKITEGWD